MGGKTLCFWGFNAERNTEWYSFDLSGCGSEFAEREHDDCGHHQQPPPIHPFSKTEGLIVNLYSCVAVGSILYRFGGYVKPRNYRLEKRPMAEPEPERKQVCCIDLRCPEIGWKNLEPMLAERIGPCVSFLDGKIYVFGGFDFRKPFPGLWAEVYDPFLNQWNPLPLPPSPQPARWGHRPYFCTTIVSSKKILVSLRDKSDKVVFHMYDPTTNSWEHVNDMIPFGGCFAGKALEVDQTLYWFSSHTRTLHAFDMERRIFFSGYVQGPCWNWDDFCFGPTLYHLEGDDFCLFWVDDRHVVPKLSHCLKIRVTKCDDSSCRFLHVMSSVCHSYTIDPEFFSIDALVLDQPLREENMQD